MTYIISTNENNGKRHVFQGSRKMKLLGEVVKQDPNYMESQKVVFNLFITRG